MKIDKLILGRIFYCKIKKNERMKYLKKKLNSIFKYIRTKKKNFNDAVILYCKNNAWK